MLVQSHCCCHYRSPQARQTPMLAQLFFAHYTFESLSVMQSFWGPSQRWYYRESSTWRHNHASRKWMSQCAHCHAFPTSSFPSAERGGSLVSKKKKKRRGRDLRMKNSLCVSLANSQELHMPRRESTEAETSKEKNKTITKLFSPSLCGKRHREEGNSSSTG